MFIGLLFNTEPCISNATIDMGFACFVELGLVHIFFNFIPQWHETLTCGNCRDLWKQWEILFSVFLKCAEKNKC